MSVSETRYQEIAANFYNSLAEARFDAGLTQAQLAEKTGLTQGAIARIENRTANPTMKTVIKIVAALDEWLIIHPNSRLKR